MPIYRLTSEPYFPSPEKAEKTGLLAVGGDLSPERLLQAYTHGIFPWFSPGDPLLWWSPDPRAILVPDKIHLSRRLKRIIRQTRFIVRADTAFTEVISNCAFIPRRQQQGTWITREMITAYRRLHQTGFAHSIEAWQGNKLVGGLYGVSLGKAFFGESMFSQARDASKVTLAILAAKLVSWEFLFIDCQFKTDHLSNLGVQEIPRHLYLKILKNALTYPTIKGPWTAAFQFDQAKTA